MSRSAKLLYAIFSIICRIQLASSPSYIHPDEHFQGPEVIAGRVFGWNVTETWEFTSERPIRSVFPLWIFYGGPMMAMKWWIGGNVRPEIVYYSLRAVFFVLSFAIDFAVYELSGSTTASFLVASSYVTQTYQTHTFSNSLEAIILLLSLVLLRRIAIAKTASYRNSAFLGSLCALGVFTRITFLFFMALPALHLIPHFLRYPSTIIIAALSFSLVSLIAIVSDTHFYRLTFPVLTPLNNILYNTDSANLAEHGIHPRYTHILVNIPQLIGPALFLLPLWPLRRPNPNLTNIPTLAVLSGLMALSIAPHQEPRFLVPLVPLLFILASSRAPRPSWQKAWIVAWVVFNAALGQLMGGYHQGGIVPAAGYIANITSLSHRDPCALGRDGEILRRRTNVIWWKTYMPPRWLLGIENGMDEEVVVTDLMNARPDDLLKVLDSVVPQHISAEDTFCGPWFVKESVLRRTFLIAPLSATFLDVLSPRNATDPFSPTIHKVWSYRAHLNLDDIDFEEDGLWGTWERVVGRRGLGIWTVQNEMYQMRFD